MLVARNIINGGIRDALLYFVYSYAHTRSSYQRTHESLLGSFYSFFKHFFYCFCFVSATNNVPFLVL